MKAQLILFMVDIKPKKCGCDWEEIPQGEKNEEWGILFPEKRIMIAMNITEDPDQMVQYAVWHNFSTKRYRVIDELSNKDEIFKLAKLIAKSEKKLCERLESIYWNKIFKPQPPSKTIEVKDDDLPF